jgi:hypothetical protein
MPPDSFFVLDEGNIYVVTSLLSIGYLFPKDLLTKLPALSIALCVDVPPVLIH